MFIIEFSLSRKFLWYNSLVVIQSNFLVVIIFKIKYFRWIYDQIDFQKNFIRFNQGPTSYLCQLSYALILCIQVLDYPSIFVTLFLVNYIHVRFLSLVVLELALHFLIPNILQYLAYLFFWKVGKWNLLWWLPPYSPPWSILALLSCG